MEEQGSFFFLLDKIVLAHFKKNLQGPAPKKKSVLQTWKTFHIIFQFKDNGGNANSSLIQFV